MLNLNSDDIFSLWSLRQNQTNELQEFHFVIIRLEYKFGQYSAQQYIAILMESEL